MSWKIIYRKNIVSKEFTLSSKLFLGLQRSYYLLDDCKSHLVGIPPTLQDFNLLYLNINFSEKLVGA